jgi:hypothetical protein
MHVIIAWPQSVAGAVGILRFLPSTSATLTEQKQFVHEAVAVRLNRRSLSHRHRSTCAQRADSPGDSVARRPQGGGDARALAERRRARRNRPDPGRIITSFNSWEIAMTAVSGPLSMRRELVSLTPNNVALICGDDRMFMTQRRRRAMLEPAWLARY